MSALFLLCLHADVYGMNNGLTFEMSGDFMLALRAYKSSSLHGDEHAKQKLFDPNFQYIIHLFKCAQSEDHDLEACNFQQRVAAQRSLGNMFLYGHHGVIQNTAKAYYWFNISAKNGDFESYYVLGQLYEQFIDHINNEGMTRNIPLALEYYLIAANGGNIDAALRYVDYAIAKFEPEA